MKNQILNKLAKIQKVAELTGFEWLHICSFSKPIVSRYISFNTRDIVYECRCGERKIKRVYRSFDSPFPIETTIFISNKEIQKIAEKKAKPKTFNRVGKI